jgi:hypothetical protein
MSFANTTGHSEWSVNSGKTYISTDNFAGAFYTYTVTTDSNLATIGTLTTVATAVGDLTSSRFGRGHHLVLNGRKLTPGANPMNAITVAVTSSTNSAALTTNNPFVFGSRPGGATVALSPSGASATAQTSSSSTYAPKFLVGVMDVQTGLKGFIDPTNVLFALYDKNRPVSDYLVDMAAGLTAANAREMVSSGQSDRVNTTSVALGSVSYAATPSIGGASSGSVTITNLNNNGTYNLVISSSIVTPNSIVILTPTSNMSIAVNGGNTALVTYYVTANQGSFTITVYNTVGTNLFANPAFNFLIVN